MAPSARSGASSLPVFAPARSRSSPRRDRRAPRRGARAHPPARRAARPTSSSTASTRRSSARSPGTSATSPTSRSSGWCRPSATASRCDGELGRFYDAIENPRTTRGELPILRGDELRSLPGRGARAHPRGARRGRPRVGADDPLLARRLRLRAAPRPRAPAQRDDAPAAPDGGGYEPVEREPGRAASRSHDGPEMVRGRRRGGRDRRRGPRVRLRQRAPAPRGRAGAVLDRSNPGDQPRVRRLRERRPAPSRRCTGSRDGEALGADGDGAPDAASIPRRPSSTSPGTRPTRSRAGPGKRLPTELEWEAAARRRRPRAGQPRPSRLRLRARGRPRRRRLATAAPCRCWATSGSGPSSDFTAYPGFRAFPYREYSEVFFGDDLQGAARRRLGDAAKRDPPELSQLGPSRAPPDLRRLPLREGRLS